VLADDPQMTVRLPDIDHQPLRVVLDSDLRLPLDAKIIANDQQLLVFTLSEDSAKIAALIEAGVEVIQQPRSQTGKIDLDAVLTELARWQCNEVLVEAGQTLSGAFIESGRVDELVLFYAASLLGDQGKSMFKFSEPLAFADRSEFSVLDVSKVGADFVVSAVNQHSQERLNK